MILTINLEVTCSPLATWEHVTCNDTAIKHGTVQNCTCMTTGNVYVLECNRDGEWTQELPPCEGNE